MTKPLTINQLSELISRHPAAFDVVASQSSINFDDIAHAVSIMAVDPQVARDVVATATSRAVDDVPGGLSTFIQAGMIAAKTMGSHPPSDIANVFIGMVTPGFGSETGYIQ